MMNPGEIAVAAVDDCCPLKNSDYCFATVIAVGDVDYLRFGYYFLVVLLTVTMKMELSGFDCVTKICRCFDRIFDRCHSFPSFYFSSSPKLVACDNYYFCDGDLILHHHHGFRQIYHHHDVDSNLTDSRQEVPPTKRSCFSFLSLFSTSNDELPF